MQVRSENREQQKSIRVNYIINVFLNGSAYILPFLAKPYVSRVLSAEGMGKVSFATSCIAYFTMFAMLGAPTYGIRACARVRDDQKKLAETVQGIFYLNLILSVFVYLTFAGAMFFVPKFREQRTLLGVMSVSIILNVIGMDWFYRGIEEYVTLAVRSFLCKFLALILIFLVVRRSEDYIFYGACTVLASFGANALNFIGIRKYFRFKKAGWGTILELVRPHRKAMLIFFAMSIATTIYTNLDVVMLGLMSSDREVGYYDATLTIKLILIGVVSSLGSVLLPRVSYYIEKGMTERFLRISKRAFNCVALMAVPLVCFFLLFARSTILLFSGSDFEGAILPMRILVPTILCIGLTNISGIQMLVPLGKEKVVLYSEIGGAVVDLIINLMLIPGMGAAGAAVGTLVAEIVVLFMQFTALKAEMSGIIKSIEWWKILTAAILGAAGSCWLIAQDLPHILILLLAAIIYFGVYGIILLLLKEEETIQLMGVCLKTIKDRRKQ